MDISKSDYYLLMNCDSHEAMCQVLCLHFKKSNMVICHWAVKAVQWDTEGGNSHPRMIWGEGANWPGKVYYTDKTFPFFFSLF